MERKVNTCAVCKRSLWHEHLGLRGEVLWTIDGEVAICCGSFDENGDAFNANCVDCCVPPLARRLTPYWWNA